MSSRPLLQYRAGSAAIRLLKQGGLTRERLGALTGPASGPKWLALVGLDQAMIELGWFDELPATPETAPLLLVGSSAGAWRMMALASSERRRLHAALREGYIGQIFQRGERPERVSAAYREMIERLFPAPIRQEVTSRTDVDLAFHVARSRLPGVKSSRGLQAAWVTSSAVAHLFSKRGAERFFEPVLLHTRPESYDGEVRGRVSPLNAENIVEGLLASGAVPIYLEPIAEIAGAPRGDYLDGGLTDYQLNRRYTASSDRITLFPHYQPRITPGWFDKRLTWRQPSPDTLDHVLQLHPSEEFLAALPGGGLPDKKDFFEFVDNPQERIRRWSEVAKRSEVLGEQLLSDLSSGRWLDQLEPIERAG